MSTFNSGPHKGRTSNQVRHSKDDALTAREFELLLEGAARMDDDYYADQAEFVILVLGRLGLRRGELTHMDESWVDWRQEMITIPIQDDCHGARNGDGVCGYCRQLAEQREEYNDDVGLEEAIGHQWRAKTPAAARDVYYGFDARVKLHISRFFDKFGSWRWSSSAVNRRVKRAAEHADELDVDDVRPHSLRATAATALAARGLEMHSAGRIGLSHLGTHFLFVPLGE